jgi:hypothetical protein
MAAYREHIPRKLMNGLVTMKVDMMRAMLGIGPNGQVKLAMRVASMLDELQKIAESSPAGGLLKKVQDLPNSGRVQEALQHLRSYSPAGITRQALTRAKEELSL